MYKVILNLTKIFMKIKEPVQFTISLIKNSHKINIRFKDFLVNGHLIISKNEDKSSTQNLANFFIIKNKPTFTIQLQLASEFSHYIESNNNHPQEERQKFGKFGGKIDIDLSKYQIKTKNIIKQKIRQCPLKSSFIQFQVFYEESTQLPVKELISLQELQQRKVIKETKDMKKKLFEIKKQLLEQIQSIRQNNQKLKLYELQLQLQLENENQQNGIQKKSNSFSYEQLQLKNRINLLYKNVVEEKQKLAEIISMITESGSQDLIEEMDKIILGENERL